VIDVLAHVWVSAIYAPALPSQPTLVREAPATQAPAVDEH